MSISLEMCFSEIPTHFPGNAYPALNQEISIGSGQKGIRAESETIKRNRFLLMAEILPLLLQKLHQWFEACKSIAGVMLELDDQVALKCWNRLCDGLSKLECFLKPVK